ncbi:MAG: DUF3040 domain-containing protein [Actinobacteria bacterium]|uniref:Unannotated protein n=1 Tax=freshwater metagenome TaxID=449393 RepID=A0A6J7SGT0_9ZZZZ|nr:DUF3040 domain-containing protein [Actinomycetota bacterium]MTB28123.1 DUF3040 domain-containing protein [Actinomycetota bacterium]
MPLSEHEQRLLEQMERALYAEDPKFATSLRSASIARASRGKAVLGVLVTFGGIGLLVTAMALQVTAVGIVGFAVMLMGAVLVYSAFKTPVVVIDPDAGNAGNTGSATKPNAPKTSFMDRVEDRWRKRQGDE